MNSIINRLQRWQTDTFHRDSVSNLSEGQPEIINTVDIELTIGEPRQVLENTRYDETRTTPAYAKSSLPINLLAVSDTAFARNRMLFATRMRPSQRVTDSISQTARCRVLRYYNNSTQSPRASSVPQTLDFRNQRWDTSGMPATIPQDLWDMRREDNRLKSFNIPGILPFPAAHLVSVKDLAADGFFYLQESDRVKCAFCKGVLKDWEAGEQVREAHRRHFSTCPFVLFVDVGNVVREDRDSDAAMSIAGQCSEDIDDSGLMVSGDWSAPLVSELPPTEAAAMTASALAINAISRMADRSRSDTACDELMSAHLMTHAQLAVSVEVARAACSERALYNLNVLQRSLESDTSSVTHKHVEFESYSARLKSLQSGLVPQPAYLLAKAGFFCLSDKQGVTCCFSCGLQIRHWSSEDNVWVEHARWSPRCPHLLLERGSDFVNAVHKLQPPVQPPMSHHGIAGRAQHPAPSASQLSASNATPSGAVGNVSQHMQSHAKNPTNEALAMTQGVEFRVEARDIKARADLPVVRLLTQLGFSALQVRLFAELHLRTSGDDFASCEQFIDYMFTESRRMRKLSLDPEAFFQARMAEIRRSLDVQPKPRESIDWKTCKVCMDKEVNILLLDCGHVACCSVCAKSLKTCPICRAFIRGTLLLKE